MGWQHLLKRTSRSPTPRTRTPPGCGGGGATCGSSHLVDVVDDAEPRDDLLRPDLAVADGREEVVDGLEVVLLGQLLELVAAGPCPGEVRARRCSSRSSTCLPWAMFSSRCWRLNHWRIFSRAWLVVTMLSQSRDGPWALLVVTISTMSPFLSL